MHQQSLQSHWRLKTGDSTQACQRHNKWPHKTVLKAQFIPSSRENHVASLLSLLFEVSGSHRAITEDQTQLGHDTKSVGKWLPVSCLPSNNASHSSRHESSVHFTGYMKDSTLFSIFRVQTIKRISNAEHTNSLVWAFTLVQHPPQKYDTSPRQNMQM